MKKSPVCFIAMAFGWEDTDAFYEKQILPTLKRNGIKPVIINRHQSNDDLNFQIFEQLDKADFCIADLTYTRPSVYFEAGYAQRAIPVIYTVRKDHLEKGQPDDLRVHFDLQMKPLVVWANPADEMFSVRLEKRLRATILKDWNRKQAKEERYEIAQKEFQQFSQFEKLYRIRRLAMYEMQRIGIKLSQWDKVKFDFASDTSSHGGAYERESVIGGYIDHVFSSKKIKNKILEISVQTYNSVNKQDLWDLQGAYYYGVYHDDTSKKHKKSPLFINNIVLSLRPVSSNQIESVMSGYSAMIKSKRYVARFTTNKSRYSEIPERNIVSTFHFLSGIDSEIHLKELLNDLIDNYIVDQLKQET